MSTEPADPLRVFTDEGDLLTPSEARAAARALEERARKLRRLAAAVETQNCSEAAPSGSGGTQA